VYSPCTKMFKYRTKSPQNGFFFCNRLFQMTAPRALIRATGFRECFNQGPPGMVTDRSLPVGQGTEVLGIALPPHVRFTKPTGTPAMSMTFPDIFGVCMSRNIISIPYYRPISFEFVAISLCFWGKNYCRFVPYLGFT
jgi:hypothetical protein